jgi:hypothetical protein
VSSILRTPVNISISKDERLLEYLDHLDHFDDHLGHLGHLLLQINVLFIERLDSHTVGLLLVNILVDFHLVDILFVI